MAEKSVLNPAGKDPRERPAYRRLCREIAEALMPAADDDDGHGDRCHSVSGRERRHGDDFQ